MTNVNYNTKALERLGYTNISIEGEVFQHDMSNVSVNGQLKHTFEEVAQLVVDLHDWDIVRLKRDQLLKDSDWTAGDDVPESIKVIARPYRQALRDITINFNSAQDVIFPVLTL